MGSARSSPSATTPGGREPSRRSWLAPCPPRWSRRRPRRPTTGHTWRRDVFGSSRASWAAGGPVAEPGPPAASSSVARASPKVAIVVLHFDQREALIACLERSEEHTSELQSPDHLVCRLPPEKKKVGRTERI